MYSLALPKWKWSRGYPLHGNTGIREQSSWSKNSRTPENMGAQRHTFIPQFYKKIHIYWVPSTDVRKDDTGMMARHSHCPQDWSSRRSVSLHWSKSLMIWVLVLSTKRTLYICMSLILPSLHFLTIKWEESVICLPHRELMGFRYSGVPQDPFVYISTFSGFFLCT